MKQQDVWSFFEHNGKDSFHCNERQEDKSIKSLRRENIKDETKNLRVFRQDIKWKSSWSFN